MYVTRDNIIISVKTLVVSKKKKTTEYTCIINVPKGTNKKQRFLYWGVQNELNEFTPW